MSPLLTWVNPFHDGRKIPISFFPVSFFLQCPQNFLTFSFNHFVTLVWNFKAILSASLKLLNLSQEHLSKKFVFLVKYNLGYDSFSHGNVRVTKLWSHDQIYNITWVTWSNFVGDVMDTSYEVITFISKYLYFKKVWNSHFCLDHQNCKHVC